MRALTQRSVYYEFRCLSVSQRYLGAFSLSSYLFHLALSLTNVRLGSATPARFTIGKTEEPEGGSAKENPASLLNDLHRRPRTTAVPFCTKDKNTNDQSFAFSGE